MVSTIRWTGRASALATVIGNGLMADAARGGDWAADLLKTQQARRTTATQPALMNEDIGVKCNPWSNTRCSRPPRDACRKMTLCRFNERP